ncbi:chromosome partitioning protein ParB [Rhodococcus sp. SRB_17]|nr:chromosome partitioning protein ParB [Rhodococcus sp. SRB_17]
MTATHTTPTAENVTAAIEVAQLHPDALEIGENVRDTVDLSQTPDFVESIRENGVLEAISAVRTADGTIVVRDGQRRTLAAREVGLTTIPVVIYPETAGSDNARAIDRIGKQITANRHRERLSAAQHTRGVAQMLEFGATITKVSKTLAMDKKDVKAQAAIGVAQAARAALDAGQLDLEHAAVVAEFEAAGDTEAVERLLVTSYSNFNHTAQRLRGLREERKAYEQAAAPFTEKGFTILPHDHLSYGDGELSPSDLVTTDGSEVTQEMIDAAPQFWAVFMGLHDAFFDKATGERVDYDDIDWSTEDDESAVPAEGLRHTESVDFRPEYLPEYQCIDVGGAELEPNPIIAAALTASAVPHEDPAKDKQERRRVRELNKQAEAATTVRKEFLRTTLLARKTPPKTAAAYVAATLARDPGLLSEYKASESLGELLGIKGYYPGKELAEHASKVSEARAQVLTLALVIAAQESRMIKDAWRAKPKNADRYLSFLIEQGYTLAAVEEIITGQLTFDEVAID